MMNIERAVIYLSLGLLLAAVLSDAGDRSALAGDGPRPVATGAFESLALGDEENPLVLRNRDGRLAWAESDHARALSTAFVHVGRAMGPLLDADHYLEERSRLEEEIRAIDEDLMERVEAFREAHGDGGSEPDDVREEREALAMEYEAWGRERTRRLGALAARQIESAYREIVAAVDVVADRLGIDVVLRFIPTANEFRALDPNMAYTAVRARIALKYPEELDITDDVLEELALELE